MKFLVVVFAALAVGMTAGAASAQNRAAELDKAYEEARAAAISLKDAEARRDQGLEPQEGEMSKPKAPTTLAPAGRKLWTDVLATYDLRVDELRVLANACGAADMLADLEKGWRDLGRPFMSGGSMGQEVEHPLIGSIDKQRKALAGFLKQLGLPDEPGGEKPNQQREAAQSRWARDGSGG